MKLLFIQGGSRWKFDDHENVYTDPNFNEHVWSRYRKHCDELTVILRREPKVYTVQEAKSRFNKFDQTKMKFVALPDIYRPFWRVTDVKSRVLITNVIKKSVEKADAVVIRSLGNIYTNTALKYAIKFNKKYLVEVTGFAKESLWYHSLHGKFVALYKEQQYKKLMQNVDAGLYVTSEALQKRYPCKGVSLGCSDVEIPVTPYSVLENKVESLKNIKNRKLVLGTAAFLDVEWKGQKRVIEALAKLKKQGINNIEYQLIGTGSGKSILDYADQLGVRDEVNLIGALPHNKVFAWLDQIDLYVQPSYMEGLCRSIVEAMSRACPVICSNVGGNYELVSSDLLYNPKKTDELVNRIKMYSDRDSLINFARQNFKKSKNFYQDKLDKKRDVFYEKILGR